MRGLSAALWAEGLKVRRSKMFVVTVVAFAVVAVMMALLAYLTGHPELAGRSSTVSAKASAIGSGDWPSLLGLFLQVILTMGTIGFGVITSWVFGREFSDRTAKDLLALPVSRTTIVVSKFIVVAIWSMILAAVFFVVGVLAGAALNIPGWDTPRLMHGFVAYEGSAVLTLLLCPTVALIAGVGRGYLLPIGFSIFTIFFTQIVFIGLPMITPFFPWAVPALFSQVAGQAAPQASLVSYLIFGLTCAASFWGTIRWWQSADQM